MNKKTKMWLRRAKSEAYRRAHRAAGWFYLLTRWQWAFNLTSWVFKRGMLSMDKEVIVSRIILSEGNRAATAYRQATMGVVLLQEELDALGAQYGQAAAAAIRMGAEAERAFNQQVADLKRPRYRVIFDSIAERLHRLIHRP